MMEHEKVWVVTVLMGLGHLRAAYPLREIARGKIIVYGARNTTPPREYRLWQSIRRFYYGSSRIGSIPVIGKAVGSILLAIQRIPRYYPPDRSVPSEHRGPVSQAAYQTPEYLSGVEAAFGG